MTIVLVTAMVAAVAVPGAIAEPAAAQESNDTVYYDDFEDGNYGGWTALTNGSQTTSNVNVVSDSFWGSTSLHLDDPAAVDWTDGRSFSTQESFEYTGTLKANGSDNRVSIGIKETNQELESSLSFVFADGTTHLTNYDSDRTSFSEASSDETINTAFEDKWVQFRIQYSGGQMRAKVWEAGSSEPSNWQIEDKAPEDLNGKITVHNGQNVDASRHLLLDRIDTGANGISGKLVNEETGEPISNGTVEAVGVDYEALNDTLADKSTKADELLDEAQDPLPDSWDANRKLTGSDGAWSNADGKYVGVYSSEDISTAPWVDSADLSPNLQVPEDGSVHFVVGDPSASTGLIGGANEYNSQVPGSVTDSADETVVIEQLAGGGDTVGTREVELDQQAGGGYLDPDSLPYGTADLPPGIYRANVEGSSFQLVFAVGDPDDIADMITQSLETEAGTLTDQAQRVRGNIEGGTFARTTTTTDANGNFTLRMPSGVERASVQAYRGDGQLLQDMTAPTIDDLRTASSERNYNGTFAIATPERHTVPADNITLEAYSTDSLPHLGITDFGEWQEWLEGQFLDEDLDELRTEYDQQLNEMERSNLKQIYQSHRTLVETVPGAQDRYLDRSTFGEIQAAEDLSNDELGNETQNMQLALSGLGDVELPETENPIDTGDGELNAEIPLPDGVDEDTIRPEIHWSNGTAEPISEEYWSVETGAGLLESDTLVIEGYPIGENDPAAFDIRVLGGGDGGVVDGRIPGLNPSYDGTIPEISAVDLNTMSPGPSDSVSMRFQGGDDAPFEALNGVEVFGPDGQVNTSIDGTKASFDTNGEGEYFVRATVTDSTGEEFVQSFRVRAHDEPRSDPPTVRAEEAVGDRTFAVVGAGLQNAEIVPDEQTSSTTVVAEAPANEDVNELHVKIRNAMVGDDLRVRVVTGSDQSAYEGHVRLVVHEKLRDGAITWRNGQPITREGETKYGEVVERNGGDKHLIRSYTGDRGSATIEVNQDPGWLDNARHRFGVWTAGLPLVGFVMPDIVSLGLFGDGELAILLVGIAARRRDPPGPTATGGGVNTGATAV